MYDENASWYTIVTFTQCFHFQGNFLVLRKSEGFKEEVKEIEILRKFQGNQDFFKDILIANGIEVIIPKEEERTKIHEVIYKELAIGELNNTSKLVYLQIIDKLIGQGAKGIILGCTEIPLLIKQDDVSVPVFDTTAIHAKAAFNMALSM